MSGPQAIKKLLNYNDSMARRTSSTGLAYINCVANEVLLMYGSEGELFRTALLDKNVQASDLILCLYGLYDKCFARHCRNIIVHESILLNSKSEVQSWSEPATSLEIACYMLWDLPCGPSMMLDPHRNEHNEKALHLLKSFLIHPNFCIAESAIHGLGHAAFRVNAAKSVLCEFSQSLPGEHKLKDYASTAANGLIQ